MSIATNLQGRLRNTSLPASSGMLPVYEAVSNAIHAIEDANIPLRDGRIEFRAVGHSQPPSRALLGVIDQRVKTFDFMRVLEQMQSHRYSNRA